MQEEQKPNSHSTTVHTNNILNYCVLNEDTEDKFIHSVQQSLKDIAEKEGYISYEVSKKITSSSGNSYFGDLYEININGKTKDGYKEIHLFLKHAISVEALKPVFDIQTCYLHEILMYNELTHAFNTLQENANVAEKERFNIAKSYECIPDAIILENLASKGFKTLHRMDVMPLKFAELAIAQLAKLHGLSFVLKHKKSDFFENKIKTLKPALHCNDLSVWESLVAKHFQMSTIYFERDVQRKIENFRKDSVHKKYLKYCRGETDTDCNKNSVKCMCHGDFRINNVMYKDNDGDLSEVVIVDYQMLFYGSPVVDLIHFIYTGTDGKFRKDHMNNLRDFYHEELTKFVKCFNLDINDVYPKNVYEKDFHDSLEYGLMVAFIVSPVIFTVAEQAPDFGKDNINAISYKMDDRYKGRITEIIEEYMAWGILN